MGYRGMKFDLAPPRKQVATHVTLEEAAALDEYARVRGLSVSMIVRTALRDAGILGQAA
jgi:Ribbon-helix-helix protein, copG family